MAEYFDDFAGDGQYPVRSGGRRTKMLHAIERGMPNEQSVAHTMSGRRRKLETDVAMKGGFLPIGPIVSGVASAVLPGLIGKLFGRGEGEGMGYIGGADLDADDHIAEQGDAMPVRSGGRRKAKGSGIHAPIQAMMGGVMGAPPGSRMKGMSNGVSTGGLAGAPMGSLIKGVKGRRAPVMSGGAPVRSGGRKKAMMEGEGLLSSLGIPIVSNLAGMIGLGEGEGAPVRSGGRRKGGAMAEGEGLISSLGIPIVSNLAGMFGLGEGEGGAYPVRSGGRRRKMEVVSPEDDAMGGAYYPVQSGGRRKIGCGAEGEGVTSGGRKKRQASAKTKERGAMVSKLMREKGMSLGEASKYIKTHGLI